MTSKNTEMDTDFHLYADLRTLALDIEETFLDAEYCWTILSDPDHGYWEWIEDEETLVTEFGRVIDGFAEFGEKYQAYLQELAELTQRLGLEPASA